MGEVCDDSYTCIWCSCINLIHLLVLSSYQCTLTIASFPGHRPAFRRLQYSTLNFCSRVGEPGNEATLTRYTLMNMLCCGNGWYTKLSLVGCSVLTCDFCFTLQPGILTQLGKINKMIVELPSAGVQLPQHHIGHHGTYVNFSMGI